MTRRPPEEPRAEANAATAETSRPVPDADDAGARTRASSDGRR